jgi:beta-N-acetylhexosaminidase
MKKKSFYTILFFIAMLVSCQQKDSSEVVAIPEQNSQVQVSQLSQEAFRAKKIIASMTDAELAAQVLMTGIEGDVHLSSAMSVLLQEIPAGAVMLFKYNLTGDNDTIKNLLDETSLYIKDAGQNIPPFIALDHEGGLVHRFSGSVTHLPAARSYWEHAEERNSTDALNILNADAFSSGKELAELGINMNLAPVAEIENTENSVFLDSRSYGPNADFTAAAVSNFADGMIRAGVLPVLKHFPGSSATDPHTGVATLQQNKTELDAMIMPFHYAVQNGNARAVMISHSIVSALDPETNGSLSPIVIEGWLRKELGFEGIIIADDFSMMAVTSRGIKPEDAVIKALNAGVNLVMVWPKDLRKTFAAILSALENESLSRDTLKQRVEAILLEKIKLGVIPIEIVN